MSNEIKCPKCGWRDVEITHQDKNEEGAKNMLGHEFKASDECLCCSCNRCEYDWYMPTIDTEKKQLSDGYDSRGYCEGCGQHMGAGCVDDCVLRRWIEIKRPEQL